MPLLSRYAVFFALAGSLAAVPLLAQTDAAPGTTAQTDGPPQPPPDGPRRGGPEHRLEMLGRELNLSSAQTAQVKTLLEAEHTRTDALRTNTALTREDRHTQMKAIHDETSTQLRALLTADQARKYEALEARMREHRPGPDGPPPPPADGPGER